MACGSRSSAITIRYLPDFTYLEEDLCASVADRLLEDVDIHVVGYFCQDGAAVLHREPKVDPRERAWGESWARRRGCTYKAVAGVRES